MARQSKRSADSKQAGSRVERQTHHSLRSEVKQALLESLRSKDTPQAAKVSAARALLEHFVDDDSTISEQRRGAELTAAELDAAIDRAISI